MQLETDQHWYALFGFFFTQQTDEQKLEIMQPWTREKVLVEMFDILKNGKDDRLKINLLIFLEENTDFFFSTHPTVFQGTCTLLNELLTLPTAPKLLGNQSNAVYAPYTPNPVKTQVLITLTTILVTSEAVRSQPSTIESLVEILFEIIMHVNDSHDRLLRQTAAEALRELTTHFQGLLTSRLGQLFHLAQQEKLHSKQSYTALFATALTSSLHSIDSIASYIHSNPQNSTDPAFHIFASTLRSLGIFPSTASQFRLLHTSQETEGQPFALPPLPECGNPLNFQLHAPKPFHWISAFRSDLETAATFILEQLFNASPLEAVRLTQYLMYLLQISFVPKELFDDVTDGLISSCSHQHKSISICTDLLVRPDSLASALRWALQTNNPILWTCAQIVLSRIPIGLIQPLASRNFDTVDMNAMNQPLNLMLRDNLLLLSKSLAHLNENLRSHYIEWISRRPVHSDADHCAYLLTMSPSIVQTEPSLLTSLDGRAQGGSLNLAKAFLSRRAAMLPTPFDTLLTIYTKLIGLSYLYPSNNKSGMQPIPKSFVRVLSIFNDAPVSAISATSLFQIITHYLLHFPSIFDSIMNYLESIITEYPKFAPHLWLIVNVVQNSSRGPLLGKRIILRLCRFLALLAPPQMFNYLPLILKLVKVEYARVDVLLEALRLNFRCFSSPINWEFGNTLLEIVHLVLLYHDIRLVLAPSCNLLATLSERFCDVEIRERAFFYLQLLTHVPPDKIRTIIELTSESLAENLDVDNPFVNTEASKLNSAPLYFKSSLSHDSSTQSHNTPPNLLYLEKTSHLFNLNSLSHLASPLDDSNNEIPNTSLLTKYFEQLFHIHQTKSTNNSLNLETGENTISTFKQHEENDDKLRIQIPFLLRFKSPSELSKEGGSLSNLPLSLYSISLNLTGSTLYANHVHVEHIPFLASPVQTSAQFTALLVKDLNQEAESQDTIESSTNVLRYGTVISKDLLPAEGSSSFPYSYSFVLNMKVMLPLPTLLQAKAIANTPEGAVAEFSMDSIPISLRDLFLPLPRQFAGVYSYDAFANQLFDEMWNLLETKADKDHAIHGGSMMHTGLSELETNIHSSSHSEQETGSLSLDPRPVKTSEEEHLGEERGAEFIASHIEAASSVKFISKSSKHVMEAIKKHLSPFLIASKSTPGISEAALLLLPHKYHLLLTFEISEESTVIRIRTDWWRIFPHLDRYFDEVFLKS